MVQRPKWKGPERSQVTEAEAPGGEGRGPCHTADARQSWAPRALVWLCLSGKTEGSRAGGNRGANGLSIEEDISVLVQPLLESRAVGTSEMPRWVRPCDARSQEGEDLEDVTLKPLFPSGTQSRHHSLSVALFFPE